MSALFPPDHPESPEKPLKKSGLRDFSLHPDPKNDEIDVETMELDELLALRARIDAKIPGKSLNDVNLTREALIQFQMAKVLQVEANKVDTNVPVNQRAQVQNSLASILKELSKLQKELYDSEYTKRLKMAVIKVLKELPKSAQAKFYDLMEIEGELIEAEMGEG